MLDSIHFSGMDIHSCINSFIPSVRLSSFQFKSIQFDAIRFKPVQFNLVQFNSTQFNLSFIHTCSFSACLLSCCFIMFPHGASLCVSQVGVDDMKLLFLAPYIFRYSRSLLWNFRPASPGWYWQRARERERERFGLRETTYKLVERDLAEEWSWHRWEDKKK